MTAFVQTTVTAVCMCGTSWTCTTTMRRDIADTRRRATNRMAVCPNCTPDQEDTHG